MQLTCPKCRSSFAPADPAAGGIHCPDCGADALGLGDLPDLPGAAERTVTFATDAMAGATPPPSDRTMTFDPASPGSGMPSTLSLGSIDDALPEVETNLWSASSATPATSPSKVRLSDRQREDLLVARVLIEKEILPLEKVNEQLAAARRAKVKFQDWLARKDVVAKDQLAKVFADASQRDPKSGLTDVFATHFTLVREGEEVYIHDRRQIRRFGKYEILGEIARGGMGVVYRARQIGLDRIIALKVLLASGTFNLESILRFQREARTTANLVHPGIVPIFDVGEVEGEHYFTMEYVSGGSLSGLIKKERLAPKRALEIMKTIAEAIDYAHQQGVIHRDLKPGNILFDTKGNPRVTDFGLAKEVEAESELTHSGQMLGTPAYMAPEQALGEHANVDAQSDVYALGAMLYELLAGKRAFDGDNIPQLLFEIVTSDPAPLRKIDPKIHPDLDVIALKAMAKDKWIRYKTAGELAADLGNFLEGRAISAEAPGRVYRMRRWVRRHKAVSAVVAASLVAIVSLGSVLGWGLYREGRARAAAEAEAMALTREKAERQEAREKAKPLFDRAQLYELNGQLDPAIAVYKDSIAADPTFDSAHLALGLAYKKKGRLPEALSSFGRAIEASPKTYNGYNERAALLRTMGRYAEAVRDYDHVLTQDPGNAEILFNRGLVHLETGDLDRARADLDASIAARSDFVPAQHYRGILAYKENDLETARVQYERALQLDPSHADARYQLARVLAEMGRVEESQPHLDRLLEADPATGARPDLPRDLLRKALSRRGLARYALGSYEEALADLDAVRALDPDYGPPDDRELALAVREATVRTLVALGRTEDAVAGSRELLAALPDRVESRALLVEALVRAGRLDTAVEEAIPLATAAGPPVQLALARLAVARSEWEEALEHASRAGDALEGRILSAFALVGLGRAAEAEPGLAAIEKDRPAWAAAAYLDALALLDGAPLDAAIWWADRARRLAPADARALGTYFDLVNRRRSLAGSGEITPEVASAAASFLEKVPDHVGALQILAGASFGQDDAAKALEWIDRAIAASPGEAYSYLLRARVYRALGRDVDALGDLGTARNLAPGRADVLFEEATVLFDIEALDDARARLDTVLAADPRHAGALLYRALARARTGDEPGALADLDLGIEVAPGADLHFNRAVLRLKAGRKTEAAEDLRKTLEFDAEYPRARELLEKLK